MKVCGKEGCGRKHYARGLCQRHYENYKYHDEPHYRDGKLKAQRKRNAKPEVILASKQYNKNYKADPENKEYLREYRNSPKNKQYEKEYHHKRHMELKDTEEYIAKRDEYHSRPEVKLAACERQRKKVATDPNYRLIKNLRGRLGKLMTRKNVSKMASAVRDLGCTVEELFERFEGMFQKSRPNDPTNPIQIMTRENYGKGSWQVDHIRPLTSFDFTDPEQQKMACHYTNLQPMWEEDNLAKSNKWGDTDMLEGDHRRLEVGPAQDKDSSLDKIIPLWQGLEG